MTNKKPEVTHKKVHGSTPEDVTNAAPEPAVTITDARKAHAFAVEDKSGHAVVTVNVPAHSAEVSVAHSNIEGCAIAAVEAWENVKGEDDANFGMMADSFRRELMHAAEGVYTSGVVMKGDTSLARFEQEVARIKAQQDKTKQDVAKAA